MLRTKDLGLIGTTLGERYRLEEELGRGGMGTVYRAHDTALRRDVAIKLLSSTRLDTEGQARLLREAQIVAGLDHPNIVTVFDVGDLKGSPFIVMQLVKGDTLHDRRPATLHETLKIIKQVCTALEHAHKQGIIHRDLKPENVVLSEDGSAKLMDFGLARPLASRMTSEGTVMGTVYYMAPEHVLGKGLDQRADLYSLGVMLYELTTGQLPFEADSQVAVLTQHLNAPVVPPRARNEELPGYLDILIVKLMEKDPKDRYERASDVLRILETPDADLETSTGESRELSLLDRIVRGRLVGREAELTEASAVWRRAAMGAGQVLLISGEPGIGKSRIVRELVTQVEVSGGAVLVGECYLEGGAPYAPFAQMVRGPLQNGGNNGLELPDHVLADLLTLTPSLRPQFRDVPPNPPLEPKLEQQRLFENMVSFSESLSQEAPLLLVMEDAHWADSGSLALLRHLARRLRHRSVMLVATYREIELDQALPLNQVLADLNRERLAVRLKLMRLTQRETGALLATVFSEEITPDFLAGIYRETEGNPFFIEEVCKALVESGQLTYSDGAWQRPEQMADLAIPQSIRVAIQSRVDRLPAEHQKSLRLAALLGREFDFDTLAAASEIGEERLIDALEAAERAQLVEESTEERGGTFRFTHALIPAALTAELSRLRQRRLHRRVAEAIERQRPKDVSALAHRFGAAGDDAKALKYHSLAGEQALNAYANQEAERHLRAALALVQEPEQEAQILKNLGLALNRQGKHEEAISTWRMGIERFQESGNPDQVARLYALSCRAAWYAGSPKRALEMAQAGLRAVVDAPDSPGLADLMGRLGSALFFQGKPEEATEIIREALEVAARTGALRVRAEGLITLGAFAGLPQEKAALLEQAADTAKTHQLPAQEARARNNLAITYGFGLGQMDRAIEQVLRAQQLSKTIGDVSSMLFSGANVAGWMLYKGDLTPAGELLAELRQLGEDVGETGTARNLIRDYTTLRARFVGQQNAAIDQFRDSYGTAIEVGSSAWMSAIHLTELLLETGQNLDEAEAVLLIALNVTQLRTWLQSLLVTISARRGDAEGAALRLEKAKKTFKLEGLLIEKAFLFLAEAELAKNNGQLVLAINALEEAVDTFTRCGMRWYRASTLVQWADLLSASGPAGARRDDIEQARVLLEEAGSEFVAMGAPFYAQEAQARLQRFAAPRE